ncbi:hypothetical protein [Caldalkalibacillus mannanilyticus]|uniref:hypothetical protein n=1 Tax=Caldalkalibacillus mannanilyticus TaxID=1418 RepID=UPI00046910ED|nr:hypothetical protein [Caldalkalibacillus mannanilyticus]
MYKAVLVAFPFDGGYGYDLATLISDNLALTVDQNEDVIVFEVKPHPVRRNVYLNESPGVRIGNIGSSLYSLEEVIDRLHSASAIEMLTTLDKRYNTKFDLIR